jgi:hypothetical protein
MITDMRIGSPARASALFGAMICLVKLPAGRAIVFPAQMEVADSANVKASAYSFGANAATMSVTLQVLEHIALTMHAAMFPDVLHLRRMSSTAGSRTRLNHMWLARAPAWRNDSPRRDRVGLPDPSRCFDGRLENEREKGDPRVVVAAEAIPERERA